MGSDAESESTATADAGPSIVPSCSPDHAALLDAVLRATPDHMYLHDLEGRYLYASPSALDTLGLRLEQMVGKTSAELGFLGDCQAEYAGKLREVAETGRSACGSATVIGTRGLRSYDFTVVAVRDSAGLLTATAATVRDVSDHTRAEEVLGESQGTSSVGSASGPLSSSASTSNSCGVSARWSR